MKAIPTDIPEVVLLDPRVFRDARGLFLESYNRQTLAALGIDAGFVQENHSRSERHVLRGLHYQIERAQGKLVRVVAGEVLDVAVDLRRGSPTFGRHVSAVLSAENMRMMWIPPGFAHGFFVRSAHADFIYKATEYYSPADERAIAWNDPVLGIDWGIPAGVAPVLSDRDRAAPVLARADTYP
jgi:dTDP-4-dehydrorhamnose 3,5-epimerase